MYKQKDKISGCSGKLTSNFSTNSDLHAEETMSIRIRKSLQLFCSIKQGRTYFSRDVML